MDSFERAARKRLKRMTAKDKMYLKENYTEEIFNRHGVSDDEINFLFDMRKVIRIRRHPSAEGRAIAEVNARKGRKVKVIFRFNPVHKKRICKGKIGIITAFV